MTELHPLGHMMRVRPLPTPPASTILVTPDPETVVRWVTVEAIGPLVRSVPAGCEALVSFNTAQLVGQDGLALLPDTATLLIRSRPCPSSP